MTVRQTERVYFSRFQVLTDGERAWTMDEGGVVFYFDGSFFLRRSHRGGAYSLVTSWRSPAYGWMHLPDCSCRVCAPDSTPEIAGGQAVA